MFNNELQPLHGRNTQCVYALLLIVMIGWHFGHYSKVEPDENRTQATENTKIDAKFLHLRHLNVYFHLRK